MPVDMELEMVLRPPQIPMPPYPPKTITLANGKVMVIRQAVREDVPAILKSVHPCLFIERDYYDIVSARLYGAARGHDLAGSEHEGAPRRQRPGDRRGPAAGRRSDGFASMSTHVVPHLRCHRGGRSRGAVCDAERGDRSRRAVRCAEHRNRQESYDKHICDLLGEGK